MDLEQSYTAVGPFDVVLPLPQVFLPRDSEVHFHLLQVEDRKPNDVNIY